MTVIQTSARTLIVYGLLVVVTLAVGYFLTSPLELTSFSALMAVCFLLLMPALLRWHHGFLVAAWNAAVIVFFLPGTPRLWMLLTLISGAFSLSQRWLGRIKPVPQQSSLHLSIAFLAIVVFFTGILQGGFGIRVLGGHTWGGRHYVYIAFAMLGYYALAAVPVAPKSRWLYASLFFLSGMTAAVSNLVYYLGDHFYFLYGFFPSGLAETQALADYSLASHSVNRLAGLSACSLTLVLFLLMRFGIRGMFALSKFWLFPCFFLCTIGSMCGGFRSVLVMVAMMFGVQFYFERLYRTKAILVCLGVVMLITLLAVGFASRLPIAMQRSLAILPVEIDERARMDAEASTQWRLDMWQAMLPELPKYFFLGKGYSLNPADIELVAESVQRGYAPAYEISMSSGDFHNGLLSVYVPFGALGVVAFGYFLFVATRLLHANYRDGDPSLKTINTFLLSLFVTRMLFFFLAFGALSVDLSTFTGILGLSACLNGGFREPIRASRTARVASTPGRLVATNTELATSRGTI